jgi:hypothetical protein
VVQDAPIHVCSRGVNKMSDLGEKLDTIVKIMGRIKFSPTGSNLDEFCFEASRQGHSLTFKFGDMRVKLSEWELVPGDFQDGSYEAVDWSIRVRYYYYQALVEWRAGRVMGKGKCVLGYWRSRERLLAPSGSSRERDVIDALLQTLDRQLAYLFHTSLLGEQQAVPRKYPEDQRTRLKEAF